MKKKLALILVMALLISAIQVAEPAHAAQKSFAVNILPYETSATLAWSKSVGKHTYYIYRQNKAFEDVATDWDYVGKVKKGDGYQYKIKYTDADKQHDWVYKVCYKKDGKLVSSQKVYLYHHLSNANPKLKVNKTEKGYKISWGKLKCHGYELYWKRNGKWEVLSACYQQYPSTKLEGFPTGTYYFYVRPFLRTEDGKVFGGKTAGKVNLKSGKKIKVTFK